MKYTQERIAELGPLAHVDDWDDDVRERYAMDRDEDSFRNYDENTPKHVREFYRQNHRYQTVEFAHAIRKKYLPPKHCKMSVWQAIEKLDELVDDSDPDTELPQIEHALQTAEAIRADNHPRWFVLTGLIHDLGKILCCFGEPQWAVVGDTFPVGCRYSSSIVLPQFFTDNPDSANSVYQTECGVYTEGCGLDTVMMSWGHDEYLYQVVKDRLPIEALYIIRYHSFYAWHREGAYDHLLNDQDREMLHWVKAFNPYDLYTKTEVRPNVDALLPYYAELVDEYLPGDLIW